MQTGVERVCGSIQFSRVRLRCRRASNEGTVFFKGVETVAKQRDVSASTDIKTFRQALHCNPGRRLFVWRRPVLCRLLPEKAGWQRLARHSRAGLSVSKGS